MNYPEIVVNFAEKTPVSFLHIFVSPSVPAAYTFNLRVGLRSWYGSASGILSPLLTICDEYHGRAVKSIITIHCLHFIENVFLVVQGIGHTRLPICEIQAYSCPLLATFCKCGFVIPMSCKH
ncbi:hypothetical protein LSAT2_033094 [Lamellibrachia satsuma]|nr:hypothetical protein LSAT2_033094 [Lamellibrachia satsuma]